jgi:hypothetical protein
MMMMMIIIIIIIIIILILKFKYTNSTNVEYEKLRHTRNHLGHRNCNQNTIKISVNKTRKPFNIFSTERNSCTRDIAHNVGSATV